MHHARQPHVLHIGRAAGDLGRDIDARHRLAHHLEGRGILQFRTGLRLHMQHVAGNEVAITETLAIGRDHRAVFGAEIFDRQIATPRGFRHQKLADLRRRVLDRGAAVLHGLAAGRVALIGGAVRIGRDDLERRKGNVEFFGGDLLKRGLETLPQLGLAGEHRDAAIGIDADPGIQERRVLQAARKARRFRRRRGGGGSRILREGIAKREADDQRAAAREHAAAIENHGGVHCVLLPPVDASAVCISRGGAMHRAQDAHMGAAAAEIRLHLGADLLVGRLGISPQQRLRPHHHAGDAVAALRRLLFHESALDRRRRLDGAETLQRRHLLALQQQQRRDAGKHGLAVHHHRAGAALTEPAAEFGGVELEILAQHIEQRRIRIGIDLVIVTVDLQCHHGRCFSWLCFAALDRRERCPAPAMSGEIRSGCGAHPRRSFQRRSMPVGC